MLTTNPNAVAPEGWTIYNTLTLTGPWYPASLVHDNQWRILNINTGASKKIGRMGAPRGNYFDAAVLECKKRNAKQDTRPLSQLHLMEPDVEGYCGQATYKIMKSVVSDSYAYQALHYHIVWWLTNRADHTAHEFIASLRLSNASMIERVFVQNGGNLQPSDMDNFCWACLIEYFVEIIKQEQKNAQSKS